MITEYFLNLLLDHAFDRVEGSELPERYYVGLSTVLPDATGSNIVEPVGGSYVRAPLGTMGIPVGGTITNDEDVDFLESTGNWGMIYGYALYDSETGGNLLAFEKLISPRNVVVENQVRFRKGAIRVTLRNTT